MGDDAARGLLKLAGPAALAADLAHGLAWLGFGLGLGLGFGLGLVVGVRGHG